MALLWRCIDVFYAPENQNALYAETNPWSWGWYRFKNESEKSKNKLKRGSLGNHRYLVFYSVVHDAQTDFGFCWVWFRANHELNTVQDILSISWPPLKCSKCERWFHERSIGWVLKFVMFLHAVFWSVEITSKNQTCQLGKMNTFFSSTSIIRSAMKF